MSCHACKSARSIRLSLCLPALYFRRVAATGLRLLRSAFSFKVLRCMMPPFYRVKRSMITVTSATVNGANNSTPSISSMSNLLRNLRIFTSQVKGIDTISQSGNHWNGHRKHEKHNGNSHSQPPVFIVLPNLWEVCRFLARKDPQ